MAHITGTSGDDSLPGTAGGDLIEGFAGSDTLAGGAGNDTLIGGTGNDSMTGGDGSDIYYVGNAGDHVVETNAAAAGGIDRVYSALANYTLGANIEYLRLVSAAAANGTGNALDNVIFAGDGANVINGRGGSDTASYLYASGAVSVSLAIAGAQATGSSDMDQLLSIENLTGGNFGDTLTGNGQANVLNGGLGADTLTGNNGDDRYYVNTKADVILETVANPNTGGVDLVYSSAAGYELGANVENLRIIATGAANATGNGQANTIFAGDGDNVMNGRAGNDTLSYAYADAAIEVTLDYTWAQATGGSGSDTVRNFENLIGSQYGDTLTGSGGGNTLLGGAGNDSLDGQSGSDYLDGGAGADTMVGGYEPDVYVVNSVGDVVIEVSGWNDTVVSHLAAYTLGDEIDNLVIASPGTASGTGNYRDNHITAGAGNNTIDGGEGDDTVDYSSGAGSGVAADLAAGTVTGGSGADTLLNVESLIGTAFNDSLTGSSANNTLDGGAGVDTMTGGDGGDVYYLDNAGDQIVDDGNSYEQVHSRLASYTLGAGFEDLYIDSAGAANGYGSADGNTIYAGGGDNVLDGAGGVNTLSYYYATAGVTINLAETGPQATGGSGTDTIANFRHIYGSYYDDNITGTDEDNTISPGYGHDTMTGGLGNDLYYVFGTNSVINENPGEGLDSVGAVIDYTLAANVEDVFVHTTEGIHLTGNSLANRISGYIGNDTLDGGTGRDTAFVGRGATTNVVASLVTGTATGAGNDTLISIENLVGGAYGDSLTGNANGNVLDGGDGSDTLTGGAGADTFQFTDYPTAVSNLDTITDFASGTDQISLEHGYFSKLAAGTLAAGNFLVGAAAADADDYIVYDSATGALYYDSDGTGAAAQQQFAIISGHPALGATDFIIT